MTTKLKTVAAWVLLPLAFAVMAYREWRWERMHEFSLLMSHKEMKEYFNSKRQYEENHWIIQFVLSNLPSHDNQ